MPNLCKRYHFRPESNFCCHLQFSLTIFKMLFLLFFQSFAVLLVKLVKPRLIMFWLRKWTRRFHRNWNRSPFWFQQMDHALSTHTRTHPFNGLLSGTTRVSRYRKGKTNLDFTEARDSEWQWHQLGHMQVCTSLQTDNHASTQPLSFLQAGCPSCRPTNSVKALKAETL